MFKKNKKEATSEEINLSSNQLLSTISATCDIIESFDSLDRLGVLSVINNVQDIKRLMNKTGKKEINFLGYSFAISNDQLIITEDK